MLRSGNPLLFPDASPGPNQTSALGFSTGSALKMSAFTKLKIAVLAPIPSANDNTATVVVAGLRETPRIPCLKSRQKEFIAVLTADLDLPWSFVSQRHHRIDSHGAPRWQVARSERDQHQHHCAERKRERVAGLHSVQNFRHE